MGEGLKKVYEFNITILGSGDCIDEAFQSALDNLKEKNSDAIVGEVIYTVCRGLEEQSPENKSDN